MSTPPDLPEFLLAREAELRSGADRIHDIGCATWVHDWICDCGVPARVLAECAAKRAIVELHRGGHECSEFLGDGSVNGAAGWFDAEYNACTTLRLLALPYADHPDYRTDWRP